MCIRDRLNIERNRKAIAKQGGGSVRVIKGAVSCAKQKMVCLYHKIPKYTREKTEYEYTPGQPNRNSIIPDQVNNSSVCQRIKNVMTLEEICKKYKPNLVKIDIEGAEVKCIDELARKQNPIPSVDELLVYYHLDKFPKLRVLHRFLKNLKRVFRFVQIGPSPMLPKHWQVELKKTRDLEGTTPRGLAAKKRDVLIYCAYPRK